MAMAVFAGYKLTGRTAQTEGIALLRHYHERFEKQVYISMKPSDSSGVCQQGSGARRLIWLGMTVTHLTFQTVPFVLLLCHRCSVRLSLWAWPWLSPLFLLISVLFLLNVSAHLNLYISPSMCKPRSILITSASLPSFYIPFFLSLVLFSIFDSSDPSIFDSFYLSSSCFFIPSSTPACPLGLFDSLPTLPPFPHLLDDFHLDHLRLPEPYVPNRFSCTRRELDGRRFGAKEHSEAMWAQSAE